MLPSTLLAAQCHRIVRVPQDTQDASGASLRHVGHGRISLAAQQALEHHTKLHAICAATAAATNMADLPPAKWGKSSREGVPGGKGLMMRCYKHLLPLGSARKFFSLVELMMSVHSSLRSLFRQGEASSDAMWHTLRREATQEATPTPLPLHTHIFVSLENKSSTKAANINVKTGKKKLKRELHKSQVQQCHN